MGVVGCRKVTARTNNNVAEGRPETLHTFLNNGVVRVHHLKLICVFPSQQSRNMEEVGGNATSDYE